MMTAETFRHFLGWCAVINYAMLLLWFVLHITIHGVLVRMCERFFNVGAEKYDSISLKAMFIFKLSIWMFNITPYLALRLMG